MPLEELVAGFFIAGTRVIKEDDAIGRMDD